MKKKFSNAIKAEICEKFALGYSQTRLAELYKSDRSTIVKLINREYLGNYRNPGVLTLESKV